MHTHTHAHGFTDLPPLLFFSLPIHPHPPLHIAIIIIISIKMTTKHDNNDAGSLRIEEYTTGHDSGVGEDNERNSTTTTTTTTAMDTELEEEEELPECLDLADPRTPHFWKFLCVVLILLVVVVSILLALAFGGAFSSPWLWVLGTALCAGIYFGMPALKWYMESQHRKEK